VRGGGRPSLHGDRREEGYQQWRGLSPGKPPSRRCPRFLLLPTLPSLIPTPEKLLRLSRRIFVVLCHDKYILVVVAYCCVACREVR
jgi:hypothetical protein